MTLIVETGAADPGAESYASTADADAFLFARGITLWGILATVDKEAALRRATDYMQQVYRDRWYGNRSTRTQGLDWPRWLVPMKDVPGGYGSVPAYYPITCIPNEVKNACILLAFKAAAGDLAPDVQPQVASESVGSISVSYIPGARQTVRYQSIDHLLALLLRDGGSGSIAALLRA